jgi:hypothetical protein
VLWAVSCCCRLHSVPVVGRDMFGSPSARYIPLPLSSDPHPSTLGPVLLRLVVRPRYLLDGTLRCHHRKLCWLIIHLLAAPDWLPVGDFQLPEPPTFRHVRARYPDPSEFVLRFASTHRENV